MMDCMLELDFDADGLNNHDVVVSGDEPCWNDDSEEEEEEQGGGAI